MEILKKLRKSKNLTQREMGKLLNISHVSYGKYENGINEPDIKSLIKISEFFNVTIDFLVGRNNKTINIELNENEIDALFKIAQKIELSRQNSTSANMNMIVNNHFNNNDNK